MLQTDSWDKWKAIYGHITIPYTTALASNCKMSTEKSPNIGFTQFL